MDVDELEYGAIVPGVVCPRCGGELVHTSVGAYCDWDSRYVPIIGMAVVIDTEWNNTDDDDRADDPHAY